MTYYMTQGHTTAVALPNFVANKAKIKRCVDDFRLLHAQWVGVPCPNISIDQLVTSNSDIRLDFARLPRVYGQRFKEMCAEYANRYPWFEVPQ